MFRNWIEFQLQLPIAILSRMDARYVDWIWQLLELNPHVLTQWQHHAQNDTCHWAISICHWWTRILYRKRASTNDTWRWPNGKENCQHPYVDKGSKVSFYVWINSFIINPKTPMAQTNGWRWSIFSGMRRAGGLVGWYLRDGFGLGPSILWHMS